MSESILLLTNISKDPGTPFAEINEPFCGGLCYISIIETLFQEIVFDETNKLLAAHLRRLFRIHIESQRPHSFVNVGVKQKGNLDAALVVPSFK